MHLPASRGVRRSIGVLVCAGSVVALLISACRDVTSPLSPTMARDVIPASTAVYPGAMHGWQFYNDQRDTVCVSAAKCSMVSGPGTPVMGMGSAELATQADSDGVALLYAGYGGTRFDSITTLTYSTYRQSADPGNNLAIALQLNVDYDLSDAANSYQGRLVYEPYQASGGSVVQGAWQSWDTKAGKWWGSRSSVPVNGVLRTNPCVQATPCTWSQLLAAFPNLGIHRTYGAVVLKAGSGWPSFRGDVDGLKIGIAGVTTTFDFELSAPAQVASTPPDTVPAWIYADTNLVAGGSVIAGNVAKNAVLVAFDSAASSADRAAALAHVQGTVVGGIRVNPEIGGFYYVRVSATTPSAALAAADSLAAAPGVALAIPVMNDSLDGAYRRPVDGPSADSWQVDPTKADGDNWALESIGAPMAWGCSTGSKDTRVAVIDEHFHDVTDLHDNVVRSPNYTFAGDLYRHGLAVASIIGAIGDNHRGSTGVMWKAGLMLYSADSTWLGRHVRDGLVQGAVEMLQAIFDGARVINVSSHIGAGANPLIPATPAGQQYLDKRVLPVLRFVLSSNNWHPKAPLFVFAAGNGDSTGHGTDAKWGGFPAIEAEYPDRVLVVAATQGDSARNHLLPESNFGPRVKIAAPGVRVMALNQNDQAAPFIRTSASTPLVAGVAGLLASFDPSLTTKEIHDYIVNGAIAGGQYADGIPYLDAYQALRLAASRMGAPLCGNRLWTDGNGNVVVERGTAAETIIQRDYNDYMAFVEPYHGGKRIDLGFSYEYDWDAGSRRFIEVPWHDPQELPGGGWTSYTYLTDHDGLMWAKRVDSTSGSGQVSSVKLLSYATDALIKDLGSIQIPGTTVPPDSSRVCAEMDPVSNSGYTNVAVSKGDWTGTYRCVLPGGPSWAWDSAPETLPQPDFPNETPVLATPAPQGDAVYVPVNIRHRSIGWVDFQLCDPGDIGLLNDYVVRRCTVKSVDVDSSVRAFVYRIDTTTGVWTTIPLRPGNVRQLDGTEINSLEVSEDGKEIMISASQRITRTDSTGWHNFCHGTLEWISVDNSATPKVAPGTVLRTVILPPNASCGGLVEAGGTISPTRIGNGGPQLMPAMTRAAPRPPKAKPSVLRRAAPRILRP